MDTDIEIVIKKVNEPLENKIIPEFNFWNDIPTEPSSNDTDDISFDFGKKKKKQSNNVEIETEEKSWLDDWSDSTLLRSDPIPIKIKAHVSDYQYNFLLDRLYENLYRDKPEFKLNKNEQKIALPPPELERQGGKRMIWKNFQKTCDKINRPVEHLKMFILIELLTEGSLNEQGGLVLRGRFNQEGLIQLVTKYLKDFVICHICQSPDTKLEKENRLTRLYCQECYSTMTVETLRPVGQLNKQEKSD